MVDVRAFLEDRAPDYLETEFSYSKLFCFALCPRKARLRYLEERRDDTGYMISGKAIHYGQQVDNLAKIQGRYLPVKEILDAAVAKLKEEREKTGLEADVDLFAEEHLVQLVSLEEKGFRRLIRPVPGSVEAPFELELTVQGEKSAKVKGFVDLNSWVEENRKEVVDYKSGSRPVYQGDAARSLQFALYCLGSKCDRHRAISFVRGGRQKPTTHSTDPVVLTDGHLARLQTFLEDTILSWRAAMKSGDWPKCAPSSHYCSAQACAYYEICYPAGRPASPKVYVSAIREVGTLEIPAWRK